MGGDSNSDSTQNSTNVDQTYNFVEGTGDGDRNNFALSEGASVGDVSVKKTDYGAIEAANEIARDSLAGGYTVAEEAFDSANNFAARSFDAMKANQNFAKDVNSDSLNYATNTLQQVLTAAADQQDATRRQTNKQVDKAFQLATTHSRSEGAEAMQSAMKIGMVGVGLFGSAYVLKQFINRDDK